MRNISRLVIAGESMRISNEVCTSSFLLCFKDAFKDIKRQRMDLSVADKELDKNAINQFDKLLSRLVVFRFIKF